MRCNQEIKKKKEKNKQTKKNIYKRINDVGCGCICRKNLCYVDIFFVARKSHFTVPKKKNYFHLNSKSFLLNRE